EASATLAANTTPAVDLTAGAGGVGGKTAPRPARNETGPTRGGETPKPRDTFLNLGGKGFLLFLFLLSLALPFFVAVFLILGEREAGNAHDERQAEQDAHEFLH